MLESLADMVYAYGALVGVRDSAICITLGLMMGLMVGMREADVPIFVHHLLLVKLTGSGNSEIPGCGLPQTANCMQFV